MGLSGEAGSCAAAVAAAAPWSAFPPLSPSPFSQRTGRLVVAVLGVGSGRCGSEARSGGGNGTGSSGGDAGGRWEGLRQGGARRGAV